MVMSLAVATALVGRMKVAIVAKRFDLAGRAYRKLARMNSTFPPTPPTTDEGVWLLLQQRAQARVDRLNLEAELTELRRSKYRHLIPSSR